MVHSGEPKKSPSDVMGVVQAGVPINNPTSNNSTTNNLKWCVKCLTYHDPTFNCLCAGETSNQIQAVIDHLTDIKRVLREIEYALRNR